MKNDADVVTRTDTERQAAGDRRPPAGTSGKPTGTNGALFGMSGEERQGLWRAWLLGLGLISCIAVVNPVDSYWWLLFWPSLFLAVTLLSLNFLGDGLRDALDPKSRN